MALARRGIAKTGGKVIKNVAGYDLAKLFAGSFGTLGAIVEVAVRLHPLPPATATALGRTTDIAKLAAAASALTHAPLEHTGLDVRWEAGAGSALARFGGAAPRPQAEAAARVMTRGGARRGAWSSRTTSSGARQREGQRARPGEPDTIVRVAALQTDLPALLAAAARHSALLVGRAGLGSPGCGWRTATRRPRRWPTSAAAPAPWCWTHPPTCASAWTRGAPETRPRSR